MKKPLRATAAGAVRQVWPLLFVTDIRRSIEFYRGGLGFDLVGRAEEDGDISWCRLERGGACIMLQQQKGLTANTPTTGGLSLYFICDDADALFVEFTSRGLSLDRPSVAEYGMKQLFVPEPDGYSICFESETDQWSG